MNKIIYIFISLSIFSITSFGQTLEQLKQENAALKKQTDKLKASNNALIQDTTFLRSQLKTCQLYNLSNPLEIKCDLQLYKISFIESKGNRQSQTVEITLLIENTGLHQMFNFEISRYGSDCAILFDAAGNKMTSTNTRNYSYVQIPSNTPYKVKLVFNNVLPGTDLFSSLSLNVSTQNLDHTNTKEGLVIIKNIKTTW